MQVQAVRLTVLAKSNSICVYTNQKIEALYYILYYVHAVLHTVLITVLHTVLHTRAETNMKFRIRIV